MLGLELERFVIDRATGRTVGYEGEGEAPGVRDLLAAWAGDFAVGEAVVIDGSLMGYAGSVDVGHQAVGISISLEPAAQLEASVGPSSSVCDLLGAIEAFDARFDQITCQMGVSWELVAQGVNPTVLGPLDLPLIPKRRYELMDAWFAHSGAYGRDMMRTSASTQVSVDFADEADALRTFRLATALGPVVSFLCDNTTAWRGARGSDTPRMVRSRIWADVDGERCGTVPGTFDRDFSVESYERWLEGVRPILMTTTSGTTASTRGETERDLMGRRDLAPSELAHLMSMVFPDARLKGFCEIRPADSLDPRLAAGLTAFVKGLFYDDRSLFCAEQTLRMDEMTTARVDQAWAHLQERGWDACVYGIPMVTLTRRLACLAETGLMDEAERDLLKGLTDIWAKRMVPRDLLR